MRPPAREQGQRWLQQAQADMGWVRHLASGGALLMILTKPGVKGPVIKGSPRLTRKAVLAVLERTVTWHQDGGK